jgi:riboflavin synthase
MFSGIVSEVGIVQEIGGARLRIAATRAVAGTAVGGSIAVNGVCLTAIDVARDAFVAEVMAETLRRTTLGRLVAGDHVNLEPPLKLGDEIGGHLVQGHVDGTGVVAGVRQEGNARWLAIEVPDGVARLCVEKGSLAVDGTSLTIASVDGTRIEISLIPHTVAQTIAGGYVDGSWVNLEADMLAKYVARYLDARNGEKAPALKSMSGIPRDPHHQD